MKLEVFKLLPGDLQEMADDVLEAHIRPYLATVEAVDGFVGLLDKIPVAAAGLMPVYGEGSIRAVAWAIITKRAQPVFPQIHRTAKNFLKRAPYKRIEAHVAVDNRAANKWISALGFKMEAPFLQNWMPNGDAIHQYVILKG